MTNVLLVRDLKVEFRVAEGTLKAVDGVSFRVPDGILLGTFHDRSEGKIC